MGDVAAWVAICVGVIGSILALSRTYGFDRGAEQEWRRNVQAELKRMAHNHDIHFQHAKDDEAHFKDTDIHTTAREKDALEKRFDRFESTLTGINENLMKLLERK